MADNSSSSGGIGVCSATFIVFLVLKLTQQIDWSWWWVTSPLWIPAALVLSILGIIGIVVGIGHLWNKSRGTA